MSDHMYYSDLPCWCGGQPAFGIPHKRDPMEDGPDPYAEPESDSTGGIDELAWDSHDRYYR